MPLLSESCIFKFSVLAVQEPSQIYAFLLLITLLILVFTYIIPVLLKPWSISL